MDAMPLAELQRLLYRLISAPEPIEEAARASEIDLARIIDARNDTPAADRLSVYAEAYFIRIHDALEQDFAALAAAIGEGPFHDLVLAYLCSHPSTSPSLRDVGDALPDFLEGSEALARLRESWPFAADLARLELGVRDVFDAADAPAAGIEEFAQLAPERFAEQPLRLVPAFRKLSLRYPVHELYRAWEDDAPLPEPREARATELAVGRHVERIRYRALAAAESEALDCVAGGGLFGDVCGVAAERHSESEDETGAEAAAERAAERAAKWLRSWLDAGWLFSLNAPR